MASLVSVLVWSVSIFFCILQKWQFLDRHLKARSFPQARIQELLSSLVACCQGTGTDLACHWSDAAGAHSRTLTLHSDLNRDVNKFRLLDFVAPVSTHSYCQQQHKKARSKQVESDGWGSLAISSWEEVAEKQNLWRDLWTCWGSDNIHTAHSHIPACCWMADSSQLYCQWWCSDSQDIQ